MNSLLGMLGFSETGKLLLAGTSKTFNGIFNTTSDFTLHSLFNFDNFSQLLPLVSGSIVAAVVLGVISGLIGPMIRTRDIAFAVHGTSELSFAGAAAALYFGYDVTHGALLGSLLAAILLGLLGSKAKERNSIIGILLPFGIGLGVLFLALYKGRSSNKFGLLTGQIVAVDQLQIVTLVVVALVVVAVIAVIYRPLFFASVDPQVAQARGLPLTFLSMVFMVILGITTAFAVQMVGALLVLSLLITPAAAAAKLTAHPGKQVGLAVLFAVLCATGGILLSLGPGLPISPYVTTVSFVIYLVCSLVAKWRR